MGPACQSVIRFERAADNRMNIGHLFDGIFFVYTTQTRARSVNVELAVPPLAARILNAPLSCKETPKVSAPAVVVNWFPVDDASSLEVVKAPRL